MTAPQVFRFEAAAEVRTVVINGEPWFVAKDVCALLGLANPSQVIARLDDDERGLHSVETPSADQQMAVINEAGLYGLTWTSRKPEAATFRRWVKHEVLPQIRRTGSYTGDLPKTRVEALRQLANEVEAHERTQAALEAAAPKVEAYDDLMSADGTFTFEAAAKVLADVTGGWGRNTLIKWLREERIVQANKLPYQSHAKWFRVTAGTWTRADGSEVPYETTTVRPEGLDYLRRRLTRGLGLVQA